MFADDTVVYATTENLKKLTTDMNIYLQKILNYVKCWKLKLNVQKTEEISIVGHYKDMKNSTRKKAQNIKLIIDGTIIENSKKVKYLGVIISSNSKFINHIKHITGKVNTIKAKLKTEFNNKYLNHKIKTIMYKQLIRPIILYACTCWIQISSNQMEILRRTERWYLRKITNIYKYKHTNKYISTKIIYDKSQIERLDQVMIKNNIKTINKIKSNNNEHIRNIANYEENNIETIKYKPISYYYYLNRKKTNKSERNNITQFFITAQIFLL